MRNPHRQWPGSTGWPFLYLAVLIVVVHGVFGQTPQGSAGKTDRMKQAIHERLLQIYTREASGYTIHRDASRREKLELRPKPVYLWGNPLRAGGQNGAVFVWTWRGRPEVVATIFCNSATGQRGIAHELHSLATTPLDVSRRTAPGSAGDTWSPKRPGVTLAAIPGAAAPAKTPAQRLVQMRALAREFSGTTENPTKNRWELRMLPQPVFRYESTDPEVLDGAVFAFVSSAGTDPEAILVIEARKAAGASKPAWQFAAARFTDMSLVMRHNGKIVFSVPQFQNPLGPDGTYRIFQDRIIPPVEDDVAGSAP